MNITAAQLPAHVRKAKGFAPIYCVYGEEPLQAQEAIDALRTIAKERGYTERLTFTVEAGFDWGTLQHAMAAVSLFAERRLIELWLGNAKPGDAGAKVLMACAEKPAPDTILLITAGKIESATQKSKWWMALAENSIMVPALPVPPAQLPVWIEKRAQSRHIPLAAEAVSILAAHTEGNLLAAAQEIEKLALIYPNEQAISAEQVFSAITHQARYNLFACVEAALMGHTARAVQMLEGLRSTGTEPVIANWLFHQDIRVITALVFAKHRRQPMEPVFSAYKVWEKRKGLLQQATQRLSWADCQALLQGCTHADQVIKGAAPGRAWEVIMGNVLLLGGTEK